MNPTPRAVVWLDRDGTIVDDPGYLDDPARLVLLPGAGPAVAQLQAAGAMVVLVTNQSGIGRGYVSRETVDAIHDELRRRLAENGASLDAVYLCPHLPPDLVGAGEACDCRKPRPGMVRAALREHRLDGIPSAVVGDKLADLGLARAVGALAVLVRTGDGQATWNALSSSSASSPGAPTPSGPAPSDAGAADERGDPDPAAAGEASRAAWPDHVADDLAHAVPWLCERLGLDPPAPSEPPGIPSRVMIVSATFPPTRCGVGDYVRQLGLALAAAGTEVAVLTGDGRDPEHQHAGPDDTRPVEAPPPPREVEAPVFVEEEPGVWVARAVEHWDWRALPVLRASLRARSPQVLSLQYHGEDYLLHPAVCESAAEASALDIPTVTTLHNLQVPRTWSDDVEPLERLLAESAGWITTNHLDEERLAGRKGAADRMHRIGTGPGILGPRLRPPRTEGAELRVGYFGFLNPSKGIEFLLRAVARLRDEGRSLHLSLGAGLHTDAPGRLRDYAASIDAEIERLRLHDVLDRRGFLSEHEVSELLARLDVAVFPFREGLSGKNSSFWSTMHHRTPTLTTRGPALPEGLVHGDNVLLAAIDDADDLARHLRWADDHRGSLEALGEAGYRYVSRRYAWDELARRTLRAFAGARRSARLARAGVGPHRAEDPLQ